MEIEKLVINDTEILASFDKIDKALSEIAEGGEVTGKALTDALSEALRAAWNLTDGIESNGEALGAQAVKIKEAMTNIREWQKAIDGSNRGAFAASKSMAEWQAQLGKWKEAAGAGNAELDKTVQKTGVLSRVFNALKNGANSFFGLFRSGSKDVAATGEAATGAGKGFNLLGQIIKAAPIVWLIDKVAKLIGFLFQSQGVIDEVNKYWAAFNGVMAVAQERITVVVGALKQFFSGDFSGAWETAKQAVAGVGDEMATAAKTAYDLEVRYQALQKAQLAAAVGFAKQRLELEKLKDAGADESLTTGERIAALKKAEQVEGNLYTARISQAKQYLDYLKDRNAIGEMSDAKQKEVNEAEIAYIELVAEAEKSRIATKKEMREILNKIHADELKALAAINDLLAQNRVILTKNEEAKALAEIGKRFDEQIQKTQDAVAKLNEIEKRRGLTPEELEKQKTLTQQEKDLQVQRLSALVEVGLEYAEKQSEIENAKRRKLQESERAAALKSVADLQKLGDLQIDEAEAIRDRYLKVLESRGASESELASEQAEFDKTIQRARLQNQLTFLENSLALADNADAAAIEQLKQQIENVKIAISTLDVSGEGDKRKTIWDMLGITSEEEKEAAKQAISQIQDSLNSLAETRIQAAEKAVEARQKEVDALEEALDKEKELQEKGLANNVALREKELATAKLQRDKALKDEAKARRAAILLDSAEQVSNLITASTKIYKSLAGAGPFGIPLAIATIALMFGSFFKAKSQALKAAEAPKLRRGAKIKGRTHEQGGELFELERDEWVIGTEHSREHDRFLAAMNRGEYKGVDLAELATRHKRGMNPVSAMMPGIDFATAQRKEAEHAMQFGIMRSAYEQGANRIVEAIEGKEVVMPFKDGYRIQRKKGNTKTVETFLPA